MDNQERVMETKPEVAVVEVSFSRRPPERMAPGAFFSLRIRATCREMPYLTGLMTNLYDHEGRLVRPLRLIVPRPDCSETDQVYFPAPTAPGAYTWTAVFPEQTLQGSVYGEARATFTYEVAAEHPVTLSVWELPSGVQSGSDVRVKVGAKCSAGCRLAGCAIELVDEGGNKAGEAVLGEEPMGVSKSLYWADMTIRAGDVGEHRYHLRLRLPEEDAVHSAKDCAFTLHVYGKAQHTVTVCVTDERAHQCVEAARVSLHPWVAYTDAQGKAELRVSGGLYRLTVSGRDVYDMHSETVYIAGDTALSVCLKDSPPPVDDAG